MSTIKLIIILIVVTGLLVLVSQFYDTSVENKRDINSELVSVFSNRLTTLGVERVGQPIEGFDAFILKRAFPGLLDSDFNGVESLEGYYELKDGMLVYRRDVGISISSAEQTISEDGFTTLLENVSRRFSIPIEDKNSIDIIVKKLLPNTRNLPQAGKTINCLPEQRDIDACIEIYQPVCGVVNVQCITEPCDPIKEIFPNSCFACQNSLVSSYIEGECPFIFELI